MNKFLLLIISTFLFGANFSLLSDFNKYKKTQNSNFITYQQTLQQQFLEYKTILNKQFIQYKKELSKYWNNPELSTKTIFIEYSKNKKIKNKIDYKNNFIEISVITKKRENAKKLIAKALYNLETQTIKQAFYNNPVLSNTNKILKNKVKFKNNIKISKIPNKPLIENVIFKSLPTPKQAINYAIQKVKTSKLTKHKSKLANEKVWSIKVPLPSNAYISKAKLFKKPIQYRANQFGLAPAVIYAIVQTESAFNPMATSYVPAFGLMQIVPKTAGRDSYEMLTGQQKILAPSYLYNPNNNILIGSAYLYKIYYIYFKKIKNPLSRLYCTIAAYNTGAGNVACAFNSPSKKCYRNRGDYSINKALGKINKMDSNEVYNYLINNLKYQETRNYLKNVHFRIYKYEKAINENKI